MFESKQISMNILIGLRSTYTTSSIIILHHPSSSIIIIVLSGYPLSTALEHLGSIAESHHKRRIWLPSPRRHVVEDRLNMLSRISPLLCHIDRRTTSHPRTANTTHTKEKFEEI